MRSGFTIIEVLVALLAASIIALISVTSKIRGVKFSPHIFVSLSPSFWFRTLPKTFQPICEKCSHIAAPIPEEDPVTRIDFIVGL